jgi:hypothetical protein
MVPTSAKNVDRYTCQTGSPVPVDRPLLARRTIVKEKNAHRSQTAALII